MRVVCDLSVTSALHRRGWSIARLFANSEAGAWYDPSDLTTLYQDAAGTTPVTADGDPVGLMLDKSGNDYHASQAVSASRPTYRTAGGLHWLEFDGVDDILTVASFPNHIFATFCLGFQSTVENENGGAIFGAGASTPGRFYLQTSFGDSRVIRQPQTGTALSAFGPDTTNAQVAAAMVGPGVDDFLFRGNQDEVVWSGAGAQEMSLSSYPFQIGGRYLGSSHSAMKFFGGVYVVSALSDADLARTEAFIARKTGVTL